MPISPLTKHDGHQYDSIANFQLLAGESETFLCRGKAWAVQFGVGSGATFFIDLTAAAPDLVKSEHASVLWTPLEPSGYTSSAYLGAPYPVTAIKVSATGGAVSGWVITDR